MMLCFKVHFRGGMSSFMMEKKVKEIVLIWIY